jgi:YVTN family beta-propeller protein
VCENTNEVLLLDAESRQVINSVTVGKYPFDATLSPDERRLYVSNRWDDTVSVVDLDDMKVVRTFPVGDDPHGLITDASGKYLYVANLAEDNISVIETENFTEVKRLLAGKYPFNLTRSPDGRYIYVSNQQSNPVPFRTPPILELTIIDAERQIVAGRRGLFSTVIGQGVAISPDNRFVVVVLELPKNLIPETQIYQGWMVTYGFAIVEQGPKGRVAYILIDEPNLYYADPYGIAFSPNGRYLYISSSGVDVVSVVDMEKVYALLKVQDGKIGISEDTIKLYARHLALSAEYVVARIPTECNPKELAVSPDGRWIYVANRLSDSITVIDTEQQKAVETIDLGGPKVITTLRKGARLFNYSSISFQKQLSCNTCHPENHLDGLNYDIDIDGMGVNLVDNRTMRGIAEIAPYKWTGKNPTIARQTGPRAAQLFFRSHGFEPDDLEATVRFIESIPFQPNRYLSSPLIKGARGLSNGRLNEFQRRGKELFERAYTNDGRYIPVSNRCITCHPAPFYTDRMLHDVGTRGSHDTEYSSLFDTPQLNNVYDNAPFLHDGRCYSLEEIWTKFNPDDLHGVTNDMKKEQLNDLIEYMKALPPEIPQEDVIVAISHQPDDAKISRDLEIGDLNAVTTPKAKYVGNQVCKSCHPEAYRIWVAAKHARAYVVLGTAMAKKIGEECKIQADCPPKSAKCLTCHATAATVSKEYRTPGFHIEEGVKCEACHGPGEKYIAEEIMRDRNVATTAGLLMPTEKDCMTCHKPKPSHDMLKKKPFDYAAAWKKIVHSTKK